MRDPPTSPGADGGAGLPRAVLSRGQAVACLRKMSDLLDDDGCEPLRGLRQNAADWVRLGCATAQPSLRSEAEIAAMRDGGAS